MSDTALPLASAAPRIREHRRLSLGAKLSLGWEIVKGGLVELWAHKLRSTLTLTLLMLGVFALVVMSSVLDGVMDKIATGFSGMSWDGTLMLDILPPGPNALGFISASPVHLPSKTPRRLTSGPGGGGPCCASAAVATRQSPTRQDVNRIGSPFLRGNSNL